MAEGAAPSDGHGVFPSNLGQDNIAQEIKSREALRDAHGREEHMLVMDPPPSSSTKSLGKATQAYAEEHDGAASSAKPIPKANADTMTHSDMDDPLKSTPVPKKNQPPKILSYLNDTRDHSPSRDEGREHDPRASNYGHDDNTHPGESSTTRSTGVVRDGITSPGAAELAKGTATASTSMKSVIRDGLSTEKVNSLGGPSSSTPNPPKAVQDAPGTEEHMLAARRPPSCSTKSRGKTIQGMLNSIASSYRVTDGYLVEPAYDHEHDEAESSTKIIPKVIAAAACLVQMQPIVNPSVRAPAQHNDGVVASIGGPAQANASDVASNAAPAIPAFSQHDVNVAIAAIGGGAAGPAAGEPNAARQVPAPAQINGGGFAVIAARPAPAQPNAGGPAPNAAPPVPVLPPNPGVHNIDEALTNSGIRPLRNPADGDEGKIWDKLN